MSKAQWTLESKVGRLYLVASEAGIQGVFWKKQAAVAMASSLRSSAPEIKILAMAVRQLTEYLAGKRQAFELPLDVQGTIFQKQVWKQLSQIPYGKTFSYKDVAGRIKNPKAVRAVGSANGKNPLCIIVPCHRVVAANGTLGGYSGGPAIKTQLLALEKSN